MAINPEQTQSSAPSDSQIPTTLEGAFHATQTFPSSRAASMLLSQADAIVLAKDEAVFGRIDFDERCITAGMRLHILQPVGAILADWRSARAPFDQLLAPHIKKIEAIDKASEETAEFRRKCDEEEADLLHALEGDTKYGQIKERFDHAEARYKQKYAENDQRVPMLWGYRKTYILALTFTGIAEWFINFDVFLSFLQVPAWAAATAIILGALLAFAAHGHGTLLKQWAFRFSMARTRAQRFTDWRFLALSTLGLFIVLSAAGGSRYAAVMHLIGTAPSINLIGSEADIDINPVRDVLISLLGNIGAWVVGVFWAYIGHDQDPDYMEAAYEREKARKAYNRCRSKLDSNKTMIRERYALEIRKKETAAQTFLRDFERPRNLLLQVNEHENLIVEDLLSILRSNLQLYHDALVQFAMKEPTKLSFVRAGDGHQITAFEFKNMAVGVDAAFVRSLS